MIYKEPSFGVLVAGRLLSLGIQWGIVKVFSIINHICLYTYLELRRLENIWKTPKQNIQLRKSYLFEYRLVHAECKHLRRFNPALIIFKKGAICLFSL